MKFSDPKVVSDKIRQANKVLLVTHSRPSIDGVSSLSVIYSLLKNYYKKDVDIASTFNVTERTKRILEKAGIEVSQMIKEIPEQSYVIKIKKQGDKIESINFNEEDDTFNFVITPFNGKLDLQSIKVEEKGASYDLIITVDTASLNFVGDFYKSNEQLFKSSEVISFDSHRSNSGYAAESIGNDDVDTTSQIITRYMNFLQIPFDEATATLLYAGIQSFLFLSLRKQVRPSTYIDLSTLVEKGANTQLGNDLLYSVYNLNEIFLVGDILDSSNEGNLGDAKIVGCKISLNKEELEKVDMEKTAQVVLWNIRNPEYKMAYVLFQRSLNESIAYVYTYDNDLDVSEHVKALGGKGDKYFTKITFESDMNAAEKTLQKEFGIEAIKQENKFGMGAMPPLEDFDFGEDLFAPPTVQNVPPVPPFPAPFEAPAPQDGEESEDDQKPKMFDPRAGI